MKRTAILTLAAVCAAIAAAAALGVTPIAKSTPVATLLAQNAAYSARNWPAMYTAYGPKYKTACSYSKFVKAVSVQRTQFGVFTIRKTTARIVGSKAYLTYDILQKGTPVAHVSAAKPDLYVKVKGLWYDELDPITNCG